MVFVHRLFPSPIAVGQAMWQAAIAGPLLLDLGRTLLRASVAFVVAMALGTAIGIGFGRLRWVDSLFAGWLVVGLNLPAIVVAIVLYIWLGLTDLALILAVIINKLPLVISIVREGVRSFSPDLDELGTVFRMSAWRRLRLIFVPQLVPFVLAAARTGLSLIWKIVLVFEVLGSDGGVGYRIAIQFQYFDITGVLAYTTAFILVVLVFEYGFLRPLERRVVRWRPVQA
ncbi:MAG: ABC transporter permease [Devosia sp.]